MDAPLHIVDATMFWSPTGGGVRRYLLAKHAFFAAHQGFRHSIAVPAVAGPAIASTTALPSWPLPFSGGYRLPVDRGAIASVLAALEPDVIEAGDPYRVAWAALDTARQGGAAAVAFCHSNLEAMARLAGGRAGAAVARRYARHLYRRFDLVLAPSAAMQRHLADWGVATSAVQPLGVDTAVFHPRRAAPAAFRMRLGVDANARVLVYAGRFAAEKHLPVLVDAVTRLGAPYVLVAIGAGPMPPPAGDRVRVLPFVGGVEALAEALASADAFVHAGDQETFGLSALEALACGTPLVVRAREGLAEWVAPVDGEAAAGVGVDRATGADFAAAIAALFEGDAPSARRAARRRSEAFAWDRVLAMLAGRYGAVAGRELSAGDPHPGPVPRAGEGEGEGEEVGRAKVASG